MIRKQLLIGILAAMTAALPAVGIYAGSAEASEIQSSNEDTVSGNKGASIDKVVTLQNSVKMNRPNLCGSQWGKYYVQSHKP